ncbi:MAG: peptide chain release factor N(5)-glutamine methyltransferase [Pseudomonadota bacterium]
MIGLEVDRLVDRRAGFSFGQVRIGDAIRRAAASFTFSSTPLLDARVLMKHVLSTDDATLIMRELEFLDEAPGEAFARVVERRTSREPIAYIVGEKEFWGRPFYCEAPVLCPRPDTETLLIQAKEILHDRPPQRILDLGTGTGALLLSALGIWPDAYGIGIDRNPSATALAEKNANRLGFQVRARFLTRHWTDYSDEERGSFDLIFCNPPYVKNGAALEASITKYEDPNALYGGDDGLDAYREVIPIAANLLSEDGMLILELGSGQADDVNAVLKQIAPDAHSTIKLDIAGIPRALAVTHLA